MFCSEKWYNVTTLGRVKRHMRLKRGSEIQLKEIDWSFFGIEEVS